MITNYEIKKTNNEEVLYLYFYFDDEFASFKDIQEKLEDKIKNFIKLNKINFTGTKVAIITGGILIGSIILKNPINSNNNINLYEEPTSIVENINNNTTEIEQKQEEQNIGEDIKEDLKSNLVEVNTDQEINQQSISQINKQQNIVEETKEIQKQQNVVEETKEIQKQTIDKSQEEKIEENKTFVTIYRTNGQVITLELEDYIIGVVCAEMPAIFNEQALMSQAIIARTYALKAIKRNIKLTDNSSTQNYKNNDELRNIWGSSFDVYYNKVANAVSRTKGLYLTYQNTLIEAVYHSTSNGYTEDSINVWGNYFPYLVSVESPYDSLNPSFLKEQFFSYEEISNKLQIKINQDTNFNIVNLTISNRVGNIEINGQNYTGVQFRNLLNLRSADFEIVKEKTGITFITKGYGHGVGMSQYGANGMAKNGYSYEQILKHYYPGVQINQM